MVQNSNGKMCFTVAVVSTPLHKNRKMEMISREKLYQNVTRLTVTGAVMANNM